MSNYYVQLFIEAIIVGIVFVILGYVVGFVTKPWFEVSLPEVCNSWNKKHMLEVNLFLIGFLGHLFFELVGANKWYCTNGSACRHMIQ